MFANLRYAVGNGDGGKTSATTESIIANTRHTIGDGDGGTLLGMTKSLISVFSSL